MKRWRLGKLLGFPIDVSVSFLLLLGVVLVWRGGLLGVAMVGLAFASVLLHELGHAVVARRLGVHVDSIELSFLGGAAKMTSLPRTAVHELAIAAAGPAVSVALAALGLGLGAVTGLEIVALIGWVNVVIAVFNLVPALPMDGGRILRALLSWRMDYVRATDAAVTVARGLTIAMVVAGISWGVWSLVILAPFLWLMGSRERIVARMVGERFRRSPRGYVERAWDDPVVMPRGAAAAGAAGFGGFGTGFGTGPQVARGGVVIQIVDGRIFIDGRMV